MLTHKVSQLFRQSFIRPTIYTVIQLALHGVEPFLRDNRRKAVWLHYPLLRRVRFPFRAQPLRPPIEYNRRLCTWRE